MEEWENEKNQSVRIAASCVSSDGCLSSLYLLIGWFCRSIPHILLFCLIATCILYGIFNVLIGPITEELFFRGYLTSHYGKQNMGTPVLIALLFSLYHLWLPFNNVFRIVIFVPLAVAVYKKKNISISILFHCLCNLFSVISFCTAILSSGSELS